MKWRPWHPSWISHRISLNMNRGAKSLWLVCRAAGWRLRWRVSTQRVTSVSIASDIRSPRAGHETRWGSDTDGVPGSTACVPNHLSFPSHIGVQCHDTGSAAPARQLRWLPVCAPSARFDHARIEPFVQISAQVQNAVAESPISRSIAATPPLGKCPGCAQHGQLWVACAVVPVVVESLHEFTPRESRLSFALVYASGIGRRRKGESGGNGAEADRAARRHADGLRRDGLSSGTDAGSCGGSAVVISGPGNVRVRDYVWSEADFQGRRQRAVRWRLAQLSSATCTKGPIGTAWCVSDVRCWLGELRLKRSARLGHTRAV